MDKVLARLETLQNLSDNKELKELCEILMDYIEQKNKEAIGFKTETK